MRKRVGLFIFTLVLYLILYIIASYLRNLPIGDERRHDAYVLIWVAKDHYFLFVWLISFLFILRKHYMSSFVITSSCFAGIFLGQVIGDYFADRQELELEQWRLVHPGESGGSVIHYGVVYWLIFVFAGILVAWVIDRKRIHRIK